MWLFCVSSVTYSRHIAIRKAKRTGDWKDWWFAVAVEKTEGTELITRILHGLTNIHCCDRL